MRLEEIRKNPEITENEVKEKACENLTKELKKIAMDFNRSSQTIRGE